MIISHKHRYVFLELPHTGTTAIRQELRDRYDGQPILYKHAPYEHFRLHASPDELNYFVFTVIRHPLDELVSQFIKVKTGHRRTLTHERMTAERQGNRGRRLARIRARIVRWFLNRTGAEFSDWFVRFKWLPYDTPASASRGRLDFVLRFEHLGDDFAELLRRLGVEQQRPLPVVNSTPGRGRDYIRYYTPAAIRRARRILGPYMELWGYEFPPQWALGNPSTLDRTAYRVVSLIRGQLWRRGLGGA